MKALSVRQPWTWALLHAGKPIENRSRKDRLMPDVCRHRGTLLLHASKGCTRDEFDDGVEAILDIVKPAAGAERIAFVRRFAEMHIGLRGTHHASGTWRPAPALPFGGIVGRARAIAHVDPDGRVWLDPRGTEEDPDVTKLADLRWHVPGSYGLVLVDREPLSFVPWKGALGLFDVPETALAGAVVGARA